MPDAPKVVTLDSAAAKRAEEALSERIDAEVAAGIQKEKQRMDAAQLQAALDAATKRADAAEAQLKTTKAAADSALAAVDELRKEFKSRTDAERAAGDAETLRRARLVAAAKGLKGDAAEAEAARLAGFGRAAIDELAQLMPAPSADPVLLAMHGAAPAAGKPSPVLVTPNGTGRSVTYTITDPALTVPDHKTRRAI